MDNDTRKPSVPAFSAADIEVLLTRLFPPILKEACADLFDQIVEHVQDVVRKQIRKHIDSVAEALLEDINGERQCPASIMIEGGSTREDVTPLVCVDAPHSLFPDMFGGMHELLDEDTLNEYFALPLWPMIEKYIADAPEEDGGVYAAALAQKFRAYAAQLETLAAQAAKEQEEQ